MLRLGSAHGPPSFLRDIRPNTSIGSEQTATVGAIIRQDRRHFFFPSAPWELRAGMMSLDGPLYAVPRGRRCDVARRTPRGPHTPNGKTFPSFFLPSTTPHPLTEAPPSLDASPPPLQPVIPATLNRESVNHLLLGRGMAPGGESCTRLLKHHLSALPGTQAPPTSPSIIAFHVCHASPQ